MALGRFRFNFTKAVQDQFRDQLESQPQRPLADAHAPEEPGVYVLYRDGHVVYVGKTPNLSKRLREHANRIMNALGISIEEMSCRHLAVDEEWMAEAAEKLMIQAYEPDWQGSGFGGHTPGSGRPGLRPREWDRMFPPKQQQPIQRRSRTRERGKP